MELQQRTTTSVPQSPILLVREANGQPCPCSFVLVAFHVENERRAKEWLWDYQTGSSTNLKCLKSLWIIELLMIGQPRASFRYIWVMTYAWDYTETYASPPCSLLCSECCRKCSSGPGLQLHSWWPHLVLMACFEGTVRRRSAYVMQWEVFSSCTCSTTFRGPIPSRAMLRHCRVKM